MTLQVNGGKVLFFGGHEIGCHHNLGTELLGCSREPEQMLRMMDGNHLHVHGKANLRIALKKKTVDARVSFVGGAPRNLLGMKEIIMLGMIAWVRSITSGWFKPQKGLV